MEPKLQRRVQRYGWDLAASDYEPLWQRHLGVAHARLLEALAPRPGERVLDVACGTGLVTLAAAHAVGTGGAVVGVDISGRMVESAVQQAGARGVLNASFARMDAEGLDFADALFDVVLCALGLMYVPDPARAMAEMRRVVRPGGRIGVVVWGERHRCGWAPALAIVDAEVTSDVCPLFFRLGGEGELRRLCVDAGLEPGVEQRLPVMLDYDDGDQACRAAFVGGPVALAWSRFDAAARARVCASYARAIAPWRDGEGYRVPSEFVVVTATSPSTRDADSS